MARHSGVGASGAIARGRDARSSAGSRVNVGLIVTSCPNVPRRIASSVRSRLNSCAGTVAQQLQIALHAARHVEQHDQTNGLRRVVEERDRLGLAFVADLEVFLFERVTRRPSRSVTVVKTRTLSAVPRKVGCCCAAAARPTARQAARIPEVRIRIIRTHPSPQAGTALPVIS